MSSSPATHPCAYPAFVCTSSTGGAEGPDHIRLHGELDLATTPEVSRALSAVLHMEHDTTVDLRGLLFMDCAGVHALVDATAAARRASRHVLIIPAPPLVQAVFELTDTTDAVRFATRPCGAV